MLDLDWERSIPISDIKIDEIKSIFTEYDNTVAVTDFSAIHLGCKNSNFVVSTNKGKYLLRIASVVDFNNEIAAYKLVSDKIDVPALLFHTVKDSSTVFIYQLIHGVSLQKHIIDNKQCAPYLVEQVAKAAAIIHNIPKEKAIGLAEFDVPPYRVWYEAFLSNPTTRARIGEDLYTRVKRLVFDKQMFIPEIDRYQSFIHSDFRPANMIVDECNKVFFVDWESAWLGHSLADVGQFFRYRLFFNDTQIELFERTYNAFASRKLPDHWFELSLFRDLVNPLQLLSSKQDTPLRNADLISVIESTLDYWDY